MTWEVIDTVRGRPAQWDLQPAPTSEVLMRPTPATATSLPTDDTTVRPPVPVSTPERALRGVVLVDAVLGLSTGLVAIVAAIALTDPFGLPDPLLVGAGVVLLGLAGFLWATARAVPLRRRAVQAIVAVNGTWTVASLVVALVLPLTTWGVVVVLVQAATVLALAVAQTVGLRRTRGAR